MLKQNNLLNVSIGSRRRGEKVWCLAFLCVKLALSHKVPGAFPPLLPLFFFCFRKDCGASPLCVGLYLVISYLSATLRLSRQAVWMSPHFMCLFSCDYKGSRQYLSSFSTCGTKAKWHILSHPQNLRWNWSPQSWIRHQSGNLSHFLDSVRCSANFLWSGIVFCWLPFHLVRLCNLMMKAFDGYILYFPTNTSRSAFARKRARLPSSIEMKN